MGAMYWKILKAFIWMHNVWDSDIPTFSAFQSHSSRREFCSSDSCSAIHNSDNPKDICTVAGCPFESIDMEPCLDPYPSFYYAYVDGSLRGELMRNKLKWQNISKILAKYSWIRSFLDLYCSVWRGKAEEILKNYRWHHDILQFCQLGNIMAGKNVF